MSNLDQDHVSTSKFYMFRCLIALAHADGVFCNEERAYMTAFINHLPFTNEQEEILHNDFDKPEDVGSLLKYVNDKTYRTQILYFARLMAYKDGILSPDEDLLLKKIRSEVVDEEQLGELKEQAREAAQFDFAEHNINIEELRPKGFFSSYAWLDKVCLALGIDLLRD